MTQELIVDVTGLQKHFGDNHAVDGIDLQIPRGSIFGFLGPNGAGKTTTINCLITLLHPTAGTGFVAGHDLNDQAGIKTSIGAVFQEQTLDEELTAWTNLKLHAEMYHIPKKEAEKRINELVEMVGLSDRLGDKVMTFSGGMRRRLEIARGLLTHPEILFLDEPTIGLDPQSRANIQDRIKTMNREHDITIFVTTHDMEEAEILCDEIYIIDKGKIIVRGTADELKASLGNDFIIMGFENEDDLKRADAIIKELESVAETKRTEKQLHISTKSGSTAVISILQKLGAEKNRIDVQSVEIKKPTLNDVFLYYTGRDLRDEEADLADRLKMVGRKGRRMGMRRR